LNTPERAINFRFQRSEDSLANKSQALKPDFFGEKDEYSKQTTTMEAKNRADWFVGSGIDAL
jgi:hypothetical protein